MMADAHLTERVYIAIFQQPFSQIMRAVAEFRIGGRLFHTIKPPHDYNRIWIEIRMTARPIGADGTGKGRC